MYKELSKIIGALHDRNPSFQYLFPSIYPSATVNFGPHAVTIPHYDGKNKLNIYIAITALGDYNADEGGHIVIALWTKSGTGAFGARIDLCEFLSQRLQFAFKPRVVVSVNSCRDENAG